MLIDVVNGRVKDELVELLERAGHTVERGSANVSARRFDVIVVSSPDAVERIQSMHPTGAVIVFTRIGDVEARIAALEVGSADALDAGFPMAQAVARIGAAGRRAAMLPRESECFFVDGCTVDLSACTYTRPGATGPLTKREVELVRWLARRAGQVVTRAELLEHVWQVSPRNETRAVDVAIAELRKKLERDPANPAIIVSVKGAGYRWG